MPRNAEEDDVVGKRPKVGISMAWWKDAWPSDTPPKNNDTVRKAITRYKRAKGSGSPGDFQNAVVNLHKAFDLVAADAKRQLRMHPKKRSAFNKDLEKAALMAADEAEKALKSGDALVLFYRRDIGAALQEAASKGRLMDFKFPEQQLELNVPEIILDELQSTGSHKMLVAMIDQNFDGMCLEIQS